MPKVCAKVTYPARNVPALWPNDVKYVSFLLWDQSELSANPMHRHASQRRPMHRVELQKLPVAHIAYKSSKSLGLFATETIEADEWLGDYTGLALESHNANRSSYLYTLERYSMNNRQIAMEIDAQHAGNESRFINHFSGISDAPNAKFVETFNPRTGERVVEVRACKVVASGKEILLDYGPRFEDSDLALE